MPQKIHAQQILARPRTPVLVEVAARSTLFFDFSKTGWNVLPGSLLAPAQARPDDTTPRKSNPQLVGYLLICLALLATNPTFGETGTVCNVAAVAQIGAPVPELIAIPKGVFLAGSSQVERDAAYRLDETAYNSDVTRKQGWYDGERLLSQHPTGRYCIARTPVTNSQYAAFLSATQHPQPDVDATIWESYGLIHPYTRTRRHAWSDRLPPAGRQRHPVVLVSQLDAKAYARWLSERTGQLWRLPTELEWEKAARGDDGRWFPWGDEYDPSRLNSHDAGPFDTTPVGRFAASASPYGLEDAAGQVFEWTLTTTTPERALVKGGSWDDRGCGVCRPAARHARPVELKHILIGFRLVREIQDKMDP